MARVATEVMARVVIEIMVKVPSEEMARVATGPGARVVIAWVAMEVAFGPLTASQTMVLNLMASLKNMVSSLLIPSNLLTSNLLTLDHLPMDMVSSLPTLNLLLLDLNLPGSDSYPVPGY